METKPRHTRRQPGDPQDYDNAGRVRTLIVPRAHDTYRLDILGNVARKTDQITTSTTLLHRTAPTTTYDHLSRETHHTDPGRR